MTVLLMIGVEDSKPRCFKFLLPQIFIAFHPRKGGKKTDEVLKELSSRYPMVKVEFLSFSKVDFYFW